MKLKIFALIVSMTLFLGSCNQNISKELQESERESSTAIQTLPEDTLTESSQAKTDEWTPMLEGYSIIPRDGGYEDILMEITDDLYRPAEAYPELLPYYEADIQESKDLGAAYFVEAAAIDINEDGYDDYFLAINSFLFGKMNPVQKLLLGSNDLTFTVVEIGWTPGNIAIMNTSKNGLPDLSYSGYHYYPLYSYYPNFYQNGRNVYQKPTPAPLYISNALTSHDSMYVKDGKLYWQAFNLGISGGNYEDTFYVGTVYKEFEGLLREPIMWAHDAEGNILEFNEGIYGLTCWFVGEVLDEDKVNAVLQSQTVSTPLFPKDYIFAYVEPVYYPEYSLSIKPYLRPSDEHEEQLLIRLGAAVQEFQDEALREILLKNPKQYESLKDFRPEFSTCLYDDFDGDGIREMLAEVAAVGFSHLWFVDDNNAIRLDSNISSYSADKPFIVDVQNRRFAVFKGFGDVSRTTDYMIGLQDGVPYLTNISGKMTEGVNKFGELLLVQTTHDSCVDGTGRTWKPYWYYLGEDGLFKEYGGVEIALDEIYTMQGAKELLDANLPEDAEIKSIYLRDNGIINLNYIASHKEEKGWMFNFYITMRYDGAQTVLEDMGSGIYLNALYPQLAVFP